MAETVRTAARTLVDCLIAQGATHAFCVPGESYLAVLDALHDVRQSLHLVTCRHEAGAANMAEAHGKLCGRPGICFVTRGPGATHAAIGVHTARQDSTPMILFIGQVSRADRDREAFQEVDYRQMFAPLAKWVAEIDDPDRMAEYVSRAYAIAMNGRPGPVVLALPEDMLVEPSHGPVPDRMLGRIEPANPGPAPTALSRFEALLKKAARPLVLLGGSGWSEEGLANLRRFVEANNLPVATTFRRKALWDNTHPNYAGDLGIGPNPKLAERVQKSDLLIVFGSRLSEMTTSGYTLIKPPVPHQHLIHIHPDPDELGKVYQTTLSIASGLDEIAEALAGLSVDSSRWAETVAEANAAYQDWIQPVAVGEGVNLSEVMAHLGRTLPHDAVLTNGAGNFAAWLHRFYQHRRCRTQLAPTSGAMGYGVPAAIAAKIVHPERTVVCVAGDGDFMMTAQELATAAQYGANVIVLIANNGVYGTIRMHQDRAYPGRVSGTELVNPDFVAFAASFGCHAARVERTEDFAAAFEAAVQSNRPAVLELSVSARHIAPNKVLSDL